LRILHISDTHGYMPELRGDFDVVVHSGDLLPNKTFGIRRVEETFQANWLEALAPQLKKWLGAKPFLFCPGNHDFVDPIPYLRAAGVSAHSIADCLFELKGVRFYGFPWVPVFGSWNYMVSSEERRARLAPALELLDEGKIDVFVAHGPMRGVLDRNGDGERCGSRVMREAMQNAKIPPKLFLHGHIHESAGVHGWSRGVIVSNAACVQRILTVDP